ncbi:hypothetical protein L484_019608 [Morus notabilis]|uniref:Uncharacterized protein n=1 Tax=Morus notabilis TaxID=981085 RepID=W9S405_9ROSA|nr:hypothetical protein L484_019608 [Morus notabilis]
MALIFSIMPRNEPSNSSLGHHRSRGRSPPPPPPPPTMPKLLKFAGKRLGGSCNGEKGSSFWIAGLGTSGAAGSRGCNGVAGGGRRHRDDTSVCEVFRYAN